MAIPPLPPLRVREADGTPNVIPVFELVISGATVTRVGNGVQLLIDSGAGATGAPVGSQYVTMALDASLTNERALAVGTGLTLTDAGANSAATISLSVPVAVTSGGTGTTTHTAFGLLYGSGASAVQALAAMVSGSLVVGSGPTFRPHLVPGGAAGQYLISTGGVVGNVAWVNTLGGASSAVYAATGNAYLTYDAAADLTAERVFTAGTGLAVASDATNFFVSLVTPVSVSSGGTSTTTHTAFGVLYGSGASAIQALPALAAGSLIVGSDVTTRAHVVTSGGAGQYLISTAGVVGGVAWVSTLGGSASVTYAATGNQYLTLAAAADLTAERVFSASTGLTAFDGGAGGNFEVAVNTNVRDKVVGFFASGTLSTVHRAEEARIYAPFNMELRDVQLAATTTPVGANIICQLYQFPSAVGAGSAFYREPPASDNRPTIVAGNAGGIGSGGTAPLNNVLYAGSYLGFSIAQVGTTSSGGDLTMTVIFRTS